MDELDWHGGPITRATLMTPAYRNTQNVRRFLRSECGAEFKFDRSFMQWIKDGTAKTMGEVADEWLRRYAALAEEPGGDMVWRCQHRSSRWLPDPDYVTGKSQAPVQLRCKLARQGWEQRHCGPEGRYGEAR
jgi:hypothetical protein